MLNIELTECNDQIYNMLKLNTDYTVNEVNAIESE